MAREQQGNMMEPGNGDTKELASKMVLIQNKRFYLDVKKNDRGLYVTKT